MKTFSLVLLAVALFAASGCKEEAEPPPPPVVRTATVGAVAAGSYAFTGTTRAAVESRVAFQVPGVVTSVGVDVGDRVRRGAPIAQLEPSDFTLVLQQAKSGLQQAEAQAGLARSAYDRVRKLYEAGVAPPSQFDAAKATYETAEAGVRAAQDQVNLAQRRAGYTRLTSPVSGAVAQVLVEAGELVAPGQPVALVTTQGSPMEVTGSVAERVVERLRVGQAVEVMFSAFPNETFAGTIAEIGVAPARTATTFPVTVRLGQQDERLRSGLAARVQIGMEAEEEPALVVPVEAVNADTDGSFVYVVEPGGETAEDARMAVLSKRAVTTGALSAGGVEVRSGLQAGETIVADGLGRLVPGQSVRLPNYDPLAADLPSF
ncbi:MAG: efflux RND transporter periplasmic adaptor subunit [Bacteroidota bacterium]